MEEGKYKHILHLDRLEVNFQTEMDIDWYHDLILPIKSYDLPKNEIFKFDHDIRLVYDRNVSRGSTFYLGFKIYVGDILFGKLLCHEKFRKADFRICIDKEILYRYDPLKWKKTIDQIYSELHLQESTIFYVEIALDTVKRVRRQISNIFQNSTLNDECNEPLFKPVRKDLEVSVLQNNQQYIIGKANHNLSIYEKSNTGEEFINEYFKLNSFTQEEIKKINRCELRLKREYITQNKYKYNISLEGLTNQQNLAYIYFNLTENYRNWNDLGDHFYISRNKKHPLVDILSGLTLDQQTNILTPNHQQKKNYLYTQDATKKAIKCMYDNYLKSRNNDTLKAIVMFARGNQLTGRNINALITEFSIEARGKPPEKHLTDYFLTQMGEENIFNKKINKITFKLHQHWHSWFGSNRTRL